MLHWHATSTYKSLNNALPSPPLRQPIPITRIVCHLTLEIFRMCGLSSIVGLALMEIIGNNGRIYSYLFLLEISSAKHFNWIQTKMTNLSLILTQLRRLQSIKVHYKLQLPAPLASQLCTVSFDVNVSIRFYIFTQNPFVSSMYQLSSFFNLIEVWSLFYFLTKRQTCKVGF